ncbi:MAG: hypothetical protein J6Y14_09495 [Fibrobacter sp.]|nr:hypothetical protein [Fibrobacter sp.]
MAKQKKSGKAEPKGEDESSVFSEIQAQIAQLIEILDRIEHRLSGGF